MIKIFGLTILKNREYNDIKQNTEYEIISELKKTMPKGYKIFKSNNRLIVGKVYNKLRIIDNGYRFTKEAIRKILGNLGNIGEEEV